MHDQIRTDRSSACRDTPRDIKRAAKRLLADDPCYAGIDRLFDQHGMCFRRRRDIKDVDRPVGEKRAEIDISVNIVGHGRIRVAVNHGDKICPAYMLPRGMVKLCEIAGTDAGHIECLACHRTSYMCIGEKGEVRNATSAFLGEAFALQYSAATGEVRKRHVGITVGSLRCQIC